MELLVASGQQPVKNRGFGSIAPDGLNPVNDHVGKVWKIILNLSFQMKEDYPSFELSDEICLQPIPSLQL